MNETYRKHFANPAQNFATLLKRVLSLARGTSEKLETFISRRVACFKWNLSTLFSVVRFYFRSFHSVRRIDRARERFNSDYGLVCNYGHVFIRSIKLRGQTWPSVFKLGRSAGSFAADFKLARVMGQGNAWKTRCQLRARLCAAGLSRWMSLRYLMRILFKKKKTERRKFQFLLSIEFLFINSYRILPDINTVIRRSEL